tara:strand:- start:1179 stop:2309 length:1131 start_codon:yes stop_codon:yes gene_type:complete
MNNIKLYKLSNNESNIFENNFDVSYSKFKLKQQISLGYHYFISQSREKLKKYKDEKYIKNLKIINNYEITIENYENSLENYTRKLFKYNNNFVLSYNFFKIWEIIHILKLNLDKSILTLSINENKDSLSQSIIMYRNLYNKKEQQQDKYYLLNDNNLENYSIDNIKEYYNNILKNNDNNKYNIKDIKFKIKFNLITINISNQVYNEQDIFAEFLNNIYLTINFQKKGGNVIFKIFDTFTDVTIKIISILLSFYNEVYIYKPLTSNKNNNEKFLICKKLIINESFDKNNLKLKKLIFEINNNKDYITNIITDFKLSNKLLNDIIKLNTVLSTEEFIEDNKIVMYINNKNYFGNEYQEYRKKQIESTENWIKTFFDKK